MCWYSAVFALPVFAWSPCAAGDTVKLSGPMAFAEAGDVESFLVTPDGARVVYRADQDADEVFELYSAPSDGSAPPIRLSQQLPDQTDVFTALFLGAGDLVVYATDIAGQPGNDGLFSVPADGSASPTLLRGLDLGTFALGAGGTVVLFTDDDGERLFSVPIDGSAPAVELAPGRTLLAATPTFWVDPASSNAVFADAEQMLCSVPIDGSAAPLELFTPVHGNKVIALASDVSFAADGVHAYYVESYDVPQYVDLYWIALDGSHAPVRLTPVTDDESLEFHESAALGRVVYRIADGLDEMIFAVDRDGTDLVRLDPPALNLSGKLRLAADGTTVVFGSNLPSALHRVPIDGSQAAATIVPGNGQVIGPWELVGSDLVFVRATPVDGGSFSGLYRIPIAGGVEPLLLNGPPVSGQGVVGGFVFSPDEEHVVFFAATVSGTTLQAVPVDGSDAPLELAPAPTSGPVVDVRFAEDGARVLFRAVEGASAAFELFSVPIDASTAPVPCNAALAPSPVGDVESFVPEFDERSVVYRADQDQDGVTDLYVAPADGSAPASSLAASLGGAGDLQTVVLARNAKRAAFIYHTTGPGTEITHLYGVSTEPVTLPIELNAGAFPSAPREPILLTPDGSRVVYLVGSTFDSSLVSSPIDGTSAPIVLALAGEVTLVKLTPDGSTVAFVANLTGTMSLHAVPVDGSGPALLLNAPTPPFTGVEYFLVSPDGSQVVFMADQDTDSVVELYRVPIDGSTAPVKLSATPVAGGDVLGFRISANGQTVVYLADEAVNAQEELFAVPVSGESPPVRLTPLPDSERRIQNDWVVSEDGELAFYRADAATLDVMELWSVRTDGSAPPLKVSGSMIAQGDVSSFLVSSDGRDVVFLADKRANDVLELFRRSVGGPVVPVDAFPAFADVTSYRLSADERRVLYVADRDVDGKLELFAARLDGSTPPRRISADLPAQADIRADFVPLADGSVLYRADQEEDEVIELFHLLRAQTVRPAEAPTRSASIVR